MNCEEVKANLSSYVAGDIEVAGAREIVGAHLLHCEACRALAAEWEASHRLLQLHQPPEFDAAFFDGLRRDVLRQISEPRPSLFARLFGQPFGQKALTYAATFSLLVCAALFASHFLRRSPTPAVEVAQGENVGPAEVQTNDTPESASHTVEGPTKNIESLAPQPPPPSPPQRRRARPVFNALKRDARVEHSTAPPETRDVAEQVARASNAETAAEREMFRIELQTSDPNVRIIWLTPRTTGVDSSNNPNR